MLYNYEDKLMKTKKSFTFIEAIITLLGFMIISVGVLRFNNVISSKELVAIDRANMCMDVCESTSNLYTIDITKDMDDEGIASKVGNGSIVTITKLKYDKETNDLVPAGTDCTSDYIEDIRVYVSGLTLHRLVYIN